MQLRKILAVTVAAVSALTFIQPSSEAAVLLDYNLNGAAVGGVADWTATTVDPGLTAAKLTRGPGVAMAGLTNGFSSDNWTTTAGDQSTALTAGDFYEWAFTVNPGSDASLSTFDVSLRRSAIAAPLHYALLASFDNFATAPLTLATFNYLGRSSGTAPAVVTPGQWMTTDTPGQNAGNPITQVDLSGIPQLQAIPQNTTLTFRLAAWGDGGGADSNTVALGRIEGPEIGGTVNTVPEPAAFAVVSSLAVGAVIRRRRR